MVKTNFRTRHIATYLDCTPDYFNQFQILEGKNRKINESHVKRLVDSFKTFGTSTARIIIIRTKAIDGKVREFLADGQHTRIAAARLNETLTVSIVEMEEDTLLNITKYVATLNNNKKAWSTKNFLNAYSSNEITEYKVLQDIIENSGLKVTDILHIFLGAAGVKENKLFRDGEAKFMDYNDSMTMLLAVRKVMPYIPNKAYIRRSLYKVMRLAKDYDRLANAIKIAGEALIIGYRSMPENEGEFYDYILNIYKKEFKVK